MKKYLALLVLFLTACGASTATQQSKLYNLATLSNAQMRAGDYHGAIRTITEIAASFESPVLYLNRGIAYSNLGHFDLAIADLDHAIQIAPNQAILYYNRAIAELKAHHYQNAIDDFSLYISFVGNNGWPYYQRGLAKVQLGLTKEAIADFDKTISLDPNIYDDFVQRANARRKLAR